VVSKSRQDHYYWLTAELAARGLQARVSRVIAFLNLGMGFVPALLIASPMGPHGVVPETLAAGIALFCVISAAIWLRPHAWPSRRVSAVSVILGGLWTSVACLIMSNPLLGLLTATTYIFGSTYIAFLHQPRTLAVLWTMAAATMLLTAVRLGAHDPMLAICATLVIGLLNVFVYFTCRVAIRLNSNDIQHGEIEPLTGLLNTAGLYARAANLLAARNRQDDRHLVLAMVSIDSLPVLISVSGVRRANQARIDVSKALRETVRRNAIAAHITDSEFIIADTFTTPDASPLIDRVQGAMKSTPSRVTASIGVVSTPLAPLTTHPPQVVIDALLAAAARAMERAREAGGNDVRYDIRNELRVDD
jgi:GGDEF domain-containing protein